MVDVFFGKKKEKNVFFRPSISKKQRPSPHGTFHIGIFPISFTDFIIELLTASCFEIGPMPTLTKLQNPTIVSSGTGSG